MHGIDWTETSSMTDIGRRYAEAFSQYFAPFLSEHEYMLEHYLVNYVHRTLFPLGPQKSNRDLSVHHVAKTIREQCLLMLVHYSIVQTMLIGLTGFHKAQFDAGHAIKVMQSSSKTFEHSLTFPGRVLQTLAEKGVKTCASLAILLRN